MTTFTKTTVKPTNTLKAKLATLVSTIGLTLVLAAPMTSSAASNAASDPTSVDSICFDTGTLIYKLVSIPDEERAVALMKTMMITDRSTPENKLYAEGHNQFISELFYFGMNSRNVFKGDRLKALIRGKCPSVYARTN